MIKSVFCFLILVLLISCVDNSDVKNEKRYEQRIDSLEKIISKKDFLAEESNLESAFISGINFNLRKPNHIILHHTAIDSLENTLAYFKNEKSKVGTHYVIAKNGKVIQMISNYLRAWHAGIGKWGKIDDLNSVSIGIELDNNGFEPFSEAQINSLLILLSKLKKEFNIPKQNIIGHSDITPGQKLDPSVFFPWKKLAENGFGLWTNPTLLEAPVDFNTEMGLKIIGYDTSNFPKAIKAFKLHFFQKDIDTILNAKTRNAIYDIYLKQ